MSLTVERAVTKTDDIPVYYTNENGSVMASPFLWVVACSVERDQDIRMILLPKSTFSQSTLDYEFEHFNCTETSAFLCSAEPDRPIPISESRSIPVHKEVVECRSGADTWYEVSYYSPYESLESVVHRDGKRYVHNAKTPAIKNHVTHTNTKVVEGKPVWFLGKVMNIYRNFVKMPLGGKVGLALLAGAFVIGRHRMSKAARPGVPTHPRTFTPPRR